MKTFEFTAVVTLDGVKLYAEAETEEEARRLCNDNKWTDEDLGGASWADLRIGRLLASWPED